MINEPDKTVKRKLLKLLIDEIKYKLKKTYCILHKLIGGTMFELVSIVEILDGDKLLKCSMSEFGLFNKLSFSTHDVNSDDE